MLLRISCRFSYREDVLSRAPSERLSSSAFFENYPSSATGLAKFCSGRTEQLYQPASPKLYYFLLLRAKRQRASRGALYEVRATSEGLSE
ncbi:hypothetical protein Y032_0017g3252 [Ancylostoma ceylanicum]|uniref:Uncharacterized protein n=1 Tax=Ancylostoma ceylanicum TaxID=53326 RepID=A0A016V5I0_9BILA|nr:hypothetical protein Y032_0017g3252 [Ancylostoma ceylanicum]